MSKSMVVVFVTALVFKGILAAQVDVTRKELLVLPGQNATFMCRVGVPLQYCRIEIPGLQAYNLNRASADNEVAYFGEGLDAGQCGFMINRVTEKNNGIIKCTLGIPSENTESVGHMRLIVAKAPQLPEVEISRGIDSLKVYQKGDHLEASCTVREGRPIANISWYLDDMLINEQSLSMPTRKDFAKEDVYTKVQNMTKILEASDNGRNLRCVAYHPAYQNGFAETKRQLDVKFPPLVSDDPIIDKFGYKIGQEGSINITFDANPKPHIDWIINGETVNEGSTDRTGRIIAEPVRDLGRGVYLANLRIAAIRKEDTDTTYILRAYNDLGQQEYRVKISTSAEPEGIAQFGIGEIIGIVIVILFVILVASILIFAKVTGRWCFSGSEDQRNIGESSDTESADLRPRETKRSMPPIKLTSLFKKNKDKTATEQETEVRAADNEAIEQTEEETRQTSSPSQPESDQALVYAELDLVRSEMKPIVKNDDEKTEYAEIVYTPVKEEGEGKEEESTKK